MCAIIFEHVMSHIVLVHWFTISLTPNDKILHHIYLFLFLFLKQSKLLAMTTRTAVVILWTASKKCAEGSFLESPGLPSTRRIKFFATRTASAMNVSLMKIAVGDQIALLVGV